MTLMLQYVNSLIYLVLLGQQKDSMSMVFDLIETTPNYQYLSLSSLASLASALSRLPLLLPLSLLLPLPPLPSSLSPRSCPLYLTCDGAPSRPLLFHGTLHDPFCC